MTEKTEQPTPKKIRDAKKKGQVAKSKEVVSLALLLAIAGYFSVFGDVMQAQMVALFKLPTLYYHASFEAIVDEVLLEVLFLMLNMLAPLLSMVFVVGIVANIAQSGWVFSGESVKPDIKKINPVEGAKKIFSVKNLMEFVKSVIKIAALGYTAYFILLHDLKNLFLIPDCGPECALSMTSSLVMKLVFYCLGVFVFLAVADFMLEKHQLMKQLKMSIDEVKREYKESEGSPEIKGKRKQLHQELMNESVDHKVAGSDVVVTNPTRLAIGIRYRPGEASLPVITIKGEFLMAKKIRESAERQGIPIIRKKYLARALYANLDRDDTITEEFIQPVAEVLRWVRDLEQGEE